jgi:hypothetical protein
MEGEIFTIPVVYGVESRDAERLANFATINGSATPIYLA